MYRSDILIGRGSALKNGALPPGLSLTYHRQQYGSRRIDFRVAFPEAKISYLFASVDDVAKGYFP
ncbi:hypothetical protein ASG57_25160 [Bradyrhizobium sp. Leaf396]|nr:hypothetical protein ASG57_25160 [Bradyrhizobium sp. Leaf396]